MCSNYKVTCQQTFVGLEAVLKTSSTRLQRNKFSSSKTSWRRVENVLRHLARRLEDVLKRLGRRKIVTLKTPWGRPENILRHLTRRLEDILKTSWETKYYYAENALKTSWRYVLKKSWRHVLKTSSRRLGDKKNPGYLYQTNLNVYVSNKSIFYKSLSDESEANTKSLIRTPAFLFWGNQLNSNSTLQISWGNKSEILSNILDKYI